MSYSGHGNFSSTALLSFFRTNAGDLLALLLFLSPVIVQAQVSCAPYDASIPRTDTIPLVPVNISAGTDMPNGTVIFQGAWFGGHPGSQIRCTKNQPAAEKFYYTYNLGILTAPMPLSSWNSAPFAGKVYETGIPGIGVAINDFGFAVTPESPYANGGIREWLLSVPENSTAILNSTRYITFIKIGPLIPGSYPLSAANLPTARLYYDNAPDRPAVGGLPFNANILQFSGVMTVHAQTCSTPDVIVPMGKHDVHQAFTGPGSTTAWVNTRLELKNCPVFYGYYDKTNPAEIFNHDLGGAGNIPDSTSNSIGIRVTPNTAVVDALNGIMAVDTASQNSASGVGIQLGWGESLPVAFNLSGEQRMLLPKNGQASIQLPLQARYIQISESVRPGRADGKATFIISYY